MIEGTLTPGAYLQQRIEQKTRDVANSRNAAGYVSMWPQAVKEVKEKFPSLTATERAALHANIRGQIDLLCKRMGRNFERFKPALQSVARLLAS
ncbi:MAG: hypothetical protein ACRD5K_16370 [Candidatus Acidiferrales bacterium]